MARRQDPDPLLLQTVSERLARLLAEAEPRRAAQQEDAPAPTAVAGHGADAHPQPEPGIEDVDPLPEVPRFRRVHVGVVAVLLLVGLLGTGWSLLRARPVALATPPPVVAVPSGPGSRSVAPAPSASATRRASPGTTGTPAGTVVVHVLGAVRSPGLVTLPPPVRVQDAIDAAGGFTRRADPGELNLAQLLQDGQQVVIGDDEHAAGEVRGGAAGPAAGSASGGTGTGAGSAGAPLDLNAADPTQLEQLPGVGPVTAAAIVAWRDEHGRFSTVEELQEVDGIGPKTYAQLAPHVRV